MITGKRKLTHSLFALALLTVFVSAGVLLAAKGGNKPPKDDPPPPPPDVSYSITLLGTLGGNNSASAMNEHGDVVGSSGTADGGVKPYVYFRDTGVIHNLYDLFTAEDQQRWISWWPRGINSQRQICGNAYKQNEVGEAEQFAVRFTPQYTNNTGNVVPARVEIVGPAGFGSNAQDINEFGDVTGYYHGGAILRGYVYTDEFGAEDIGDLGEGYTYAYAINNSGQITGSFWFADGEGRAFRFTPGVGMEDLGIIKTSNDPSHEDFSHGRDINDFGVVVGFSPAGKHKGFAVTHAFREAGQGMDDLGTLEGSDGGAVSRAGSINSHGEIIGSAQDKDNRIVKFLYTEQFGMVELEPLIVNLPSDTTIIGATQINDAGEICGEIRFMDGSSEAILLTLTPNK